jgi:hypothetical protein
MAPVQQPSTPFGGLHSVMEFEALTIQVPTMSVTGARIKVKRHFTAQPFIAFSAIWDSAGCVLLTP